jgi:hypothetical protein
MLISIVGEVTLCNTDVQGSTTQWETHPDVMQVHSYLRSLTSSHPHVDVTSQVALAQHNQLMRENILKFRGYSIHFISLRANVFPLLDLLNDTMNQQL